jgi:hypothetical protein
MSRETTRELSLEERVTRIEDVREIEKIKMLYTEGTDFGYDLDQIASCFTEDGRWVSEGFADCHGREAIKEFFGQLKLAVTMALHYTTNPRIDVDPGGVTAAAKFHLWCACTMKRPDESGEEDAITMIGTYSDRFEKVDGTWLIKELNAHVRHVSEWTKGWALDPWRI